MRYRATGTVQLLDEETGQQLDVELVDIVVESVDVRHVNVDDERFNRPPHSPWSFPTHMKATVLARLGPDVMYRVVTKP